MRSTRRALAPALLAPAVLGIALLAPVALAGPAAAAPSAATSVTDPVTPELGTDDPIAEEPPGGAVCNPDLPTEGCEQEGGTPGTPGDSGGSGGPEAGQPAPAPAPRATSGSGSSGRTPTVTPAGSRPAAPAALPTQLPRTGPQDALLTALAGLAALGGGVALVLGSRPRRAAVAA